MALPIVALPIHQWCNQNGLPYAAGTISTYVMGTSTPKPTYLDPALSAMNTNPVVLDSAGRATMFGDGDFRLVLHDAIGNEIFDVPASSLASAAMAPVVDAPTIEDAVDLLGIPALIEVETDRAEAAEGALSASIAAETTRAEAAEGALNTAINAEVTRAEAEEAHLQSEIDTINAEISGGGGALFGAVHDVTSSRAFGTVYTNSTGGPMFVAVTWSTQSGIMLSEPFGTVTFLVNSVVVTEFVVYLPGDGSAVVGAAYAMVPGGVTYEITAGGTYDSGYIVELWIETH